MSSFLPLAYESNLVTLPTQRKLSNNSLENVYNVKLFVPLSLSTRRTYGHGDVSIVLTASE